MTISRAQMKDRSFCPYMKAESDVICHTYQHKNETTLSHRQGCQPAVSSVLFIDIFAFFA